MSDIVFLRAWVPVQPPKFYNPITNLLSRDKSAVTAMKTVFQMRQERNIAPPLQKDSLYKVGGMSLSCATPCCTMVVKLTKRHACSRL